MTDKQQFFCEEYLKDFNATQAAIRAGYSTQSAYSIGHENLKKPEIQDYINLKKKEYFKFNKLTLNTLIADLVHVKNKAIYENFDAKNGIKACEALSRLITLEEIKQKELVSRLSDEELEKMARDLLNQLDSYARQHCIKNS